MKSIFKSRTFWLAVVQAVLGAVVAVDFSQPTIGIAIIAKSVIDVVLRFLTDTPVSLADNSQL